jgi:hypothetical protein
MSGVVLTVGALALDTIFRLDHLPHASGKFLPLDSIQVTQGMATAQATTIAKLGGIGPADIDADHGDIIEYRHRVGTRADRGIVMRHDDALALPVDEDRGKAGGCASYAADR